VLRRVIVPLVRPGIVAGSILVFVPALGAYVTPRVLGGGKNLMLGNLIELQFGQGRNWPLGAALSMTLLLIVAAALVVYVRNATQGEHGGLALDPGLLGNPPAGHDRAGTAVLRAALRADRDAGDLLVQRRQLDRGLGGAVLALVRRRLAERPGPGGGAALAGDRELRGDHRDAICHDGGARHHPHRPVPRPHRHLSRCSRLRVY
jgi:hypothetical protein